jgi:pectin methylesterase-like acyl-CoA thioesterase
MLLDCYEICDNVSTLYMRMKRLLLLALLVSLSRGAAKDLIVSADGSGDFKTVQAAVDAVPANSDSRTTILIKKGTYAELVVVATEKKKLTIRGEDRKQTIIAATNNANLNPRRREMFSMMADDFRLENLTLFNTTPKGGSQAEAIRVRADRVVLEHCDFKSFQDTLRLDGRVYVRECYIEGDVDFIWGSGTVYFDRCDIFAVNDGYLVQSRNGANQLGYVFVGCRLDTRPGLKRFVLARIDPGRFPHSHVAFIHCAMGKFVTPAGWMFDGPGAGASKETTRFGEFLSTDLTGQPLDVSHRVAGSRQLTAEEAARLRDLAHVLGGADGWNPNAK